MTLKELLDKKVAKVNQLKLDLPKVLANECVKFFGNSFKQQGWKDTNFVNWKKRKVETSKTKGKPILVGTGALRRAVLTSRRQATFDKIHFVVDLPYAKLHNEGGVVTRKAHKRSVFKSESYTHTGIFTGSKTKQKRHKIEKQYGVGSYVAKYPKRKFMGGSAELDKIIQKRINLALKKIWLG